MTAQLNDIQVYRGDNAYIVLRFAQAGETTTTPYPLTVYSEIMMDIREDYESSPLIVRKSLTLGTIQIDGVNNDTLNIELTSADTKNFYGGKYRLDIRFFVGNTVRTHLKGIVYVTENTTAI